MARAKAWTASSTKTESASKDAPGSAPPMKNPATKGGISGWCIKDRPQCTVQTQGLSKGAQLALVWVLNAPETTVAQKAASRFLTLVTTAGSNTKVPLTEALS
jgi:hypothetical protein